MKKEAARARRRILTDGDAYAARGAREGSAPARAGRNAAATRPTTHAGRSAISGLASTMMSRSMVSSFATSDAGPVYWITPSPFRSSKARSRPEFIVK